MVWYERVIRHFEITLSSTVYVIKNYLLFVYETEKILF